MLLIIINWIKLISGNKRVICDFWNYNFKFKDKNYILDRKVRGLSPALGSKFSTKISHFDQSLNLGAITYTSPYPFLKIVFTVETYKANSWVLVRIPQNVSRVWRCISKVSGPEFETLMTKDVTLLGLPEFRGKREELESLFLMFRNRNLWMLLLKVSC